MIVLEAHRFRKFAERRLPGFLQSRFFYLIGVIMAMFGGLLVVAYVRSGFEIKPVLAIQIGVSAPFLMESFLGRLPIQPGKVN